MTSTKVIAGHQGILNVFLQISPGCHWLRSKDKKKCFLLTHQRVKIERTETCQKKKNGQQIEKLPHPPRPPHSLAEDDKLTHRILSEQIMCSTRVFVLYGLCSGEMGLNHSILSPWLSTLLSVCIFHPFYSFRDTCQTSSSAASLCTDNVDSVLFILRL